MAARSAGLLLALCALAPCSAEDGGYTLPVLNDSYVSSPRFASHGLAPFSRGVSLFLRAIQQHELLPPDLLLVQGGQIHLNENVDFENVAKFYYGVLVVLCVGLAVVLGAPIAGLLCCCCCCGGNTRHKRRPPMCDDGFMRGKESSGAPLFAPLVLCGITCIIVAGVAIAFAANAYVEQGLGGIGRHVSDGTQDVRLYVDNAQTELDTILGVNFDKLSVGLNTVLGGAIDETTTIVNNFVDSLPLATLEEMTRGLENIQTDLQNVMEAMKACNDTAKDINRDITSIQPDVQQICMALGDQCPEGLRNFNPPVFNQLPDGDITTSSNDMSQILTTNFKDALRAGRRTVDTLGIQVQNVMREVSVTMNDSIDNMRSKLRKIISDTLQATTDASNTLDSLDQKVLDIQVTYNDSYANYRIIAFTIYTALILIIAVLITIGLMCGGCGSKHSYSFLNLPVILIVCTISIWMLLVTALFITGLATDRVCEFLRKPEECQLSQLIDKLLQQNRANVTDSELLPPLQNFSVYIKECREDKTLYEVIGLESTIHLDDIQNNVADFDFEPYLEKVDTKMDEVVGTQLLPPAIKDNIIELQKSEISNVDLRSVNGELDKFEQIAVQFQGLANTWITELEQLPAINEDTLSKLRNVVARTETLVKTDTTKLGSSLSSLESHVKLGHDSFSEAMQWILDEADKTESIIGESSPRVKMVAKNTADRFKQELDDYLRWSVNRVKSDALKCRPIINIYDTLVMGVCDEIVSPYNVFWAISGLCLLLFVPAACVAKSLAARSS